MSNLATITNNILADSGIDDINVVVTTGSYANPAWITSLAWTKITGAPTNIITGTGAAGQVAFFNGTTTIASEINLLWDSSNNRLGIGVTPTQALDVVGKIKATDDLVLAQQNPAITFDNGTSGTLRIFSSFAAAAIATFNSTGVFTLNQYGTGARTGTRAYDLAVDASGNVIEVPVGAGTITGGGTAGQVPYFNGPSSIASDANFTYNNVTNVFSVNGWVDSYRRFRLYFNDLQTLAAELYEDGASTNGGTLTLYGKASGTIDTIISAAPTKLNYINNAANVMIGWNTDQGYKLAVNGGFYASAEAVIGSTITVGPIDGSFLRTFGATNGNLRWAFINSSSGIFSIQQQGDGYANQGDRLTINRSGVATFASSINSGGWFAAPNEYGLTALNAAGTAGRVLIKLNSSNQIEIGRDSDISAIRLGTASAVDAFTMLSNGNVGIAFTNPSQALQVNGRVRVSPDSSNGGDLAVNDGGLALSAIGSAPIQFWRSNYNFLSMIIDSNGNLGVGTTNLPFRLNIESTSEAVARIKSTNASGAARLILNPEGAGAGSTGDASIFFDCNSTAWVAGVDKSDSSRFKIAVDPYGDFRAGVHLSIDNVTDRSNVVIGGTTAVNSAVNRGNLTINGSASSIMNLTVNNAIRGYMYHNGTTMDVANIADGDIEFFANNTLIAAVKAATSGQRNFVVGNAFPISTGANRANITINGNSTSILAFGTSNVQRGYLYCDGTSFYMNAGAGDFTIENNTTTALVVKQNGRVGINTTDPQAPLQVNGNFRLYTTNNDGNELRGIFNVGGAADPLSFSMYKGDAATIGILLSADGTTYFNGTNVLVGTTSDIGTAFRVVGGATGIDFETNVSSTYARSIFFTTRETGVAREIGLTGGYSYGPSNPLTMVLTQTSDTPIAMFRASDDAVGAGLKGYKSRGTVATPASVANGDIIFSMEGWAFHGSGPNNAKFGAGMRFVKDDAFGTANTFAPQRTEFYNANSTTTTITTFTILPNANCTAGGSMTATSFFESSDSRIKTLLDNNVDYSLIANVGAKYYKKGDIEELGYFAQDFEQILPSAVYKDEKGLLNLSYTQVHTAKIAVLEARVKELEQQLKNK